MQANSIVAGIVALGVTLASCSGGAGDAAVGPAKQELRGAAEPVRAPADSIDAAVRRHYAEGLPYAEIHRFGPAALPRLRAMLNDPAERDYWPNIAGAIGFIDGPGASTTLIGFIDASSDRALDADSYRAALTAVMALGYVANSGDARALSYLAAAARRSNAPSQRTDSLRLDPSAVGVQAILGLGLSGRPEARIVLEELKRSQDASLRERATDSLRIHEAVASKGLAEYFRHP